MKVLIYKYKSDLAPVGGSNGYCFNIYQELKKRNETSISFLENKKGSKYQSNTLKKYFQTFFSFFKKDTQTDLFSKYDVIHFHSTKDFYKCRKSLRKFKGKTILTMHSPIPFHMEMVENIKRHHKFLGTLLRHHAFSKIDKYSFDHCDYILLPCKEAEESYYLHWKKYKRIHNNNESKYRYIPTGIVQAFPKIDAEHYRNELGYTKDDFIVSYVGRHNKVKGYDRIIKVCEQLNNENVKFLIGGKEFPLKGPDYSNWKEIGWTNDPYSLINASNVFILPNRETYFDIVLLEVLSLGKPCIISNSGGNKVVLFKGCKHIFKFDNEKECSEIIDKLFKDEHSYKPITEIIDLFKNNYSIELFVDKYLELLNSIYLRLKSER